MAEEVRHWTEQEQQKLFDDYFSPLPGVCPVCQTEVCMLMSHLGREVTLLLTCEVCGNKASVNRMLPLEGPLPPNPPEQAGGEVKV